MSKPSIVCVPGAWHTPEIYNSVLRNLEQHGYPTIGLPLPSVGAPPALLSLDEDVKAIRNCLSKLGVDEGKDVFLVTHSYTGMPGAEAPVGLGKNEREEKGLKGGVTRLVFIMAFAMLEGFQPTAGGAQYPEWMKLDRENAVVNETAEEAKSIFYNDISPEEGDKWATTLAPQSVGVYSSIQTYAAWRYIPSTYVIGKNDKTSFSPEVVDYIINTAKTAEPTAFDVVEECDGGHCLMISRPEWLAGLLRRAAGENVRGRLRPINVVKTIEY